MDGTEKLSRQVRRGLRERKTNVLRSERFMMMMMMIPLISRPCGVSFYRVGKVHVWRGALGAGCWALGAGRLKGRRRSRLRFVVSCVRAWVKVSEKGGGGFVLCTFIEGGGRLSLLVMMDGI